MKTVNTPIVGVIVPVFNVEMHLVEKCISSILRQTYKEIKIIIVDDGNEKEYSDRLSSFSKSDDRIKIIRHSSNRGLYQARLTGVNACDTDYIIFVDGDDEITVDWIRLLVNKAQDENADIVMAKTILKDQNEWKYVFNANYSICNKTAICGKDIFEFLLKDCGLDFSIHTVWNKLYSKELWKKAWEDLNRINGHLIMTEDIMFSFVLFYHAQKMAFSNHEGYIYFRNSESSTISGAKPDKIKKNIQDLKCVFLNIESFMKKYSVFYHYKLYYDEWRNRYFRWWSYNVKSACENLPYSEAEVIKKDYLKIFDKKEYEPAIAGDSYFDEKKTGWNSTLENIKNAIASKQCEVVSFDLFDTLIERPVLNPEDVFEVLVFDVDILPYEKDTMIKYRKLAEIQARAEIKSQYPQYEDVTLSEIYEIMHVKFGIPEELCNKLRTKEEDVEIEFAQRRNIGYELYTLALCCGKKLYITSDMYLRKEVITEILEKNSYIDYSGIYLSSEKRLLKKTGNLFKIFIKETKCDPKKIIHIGDNWESDVNIPLRYGIKTFFMPKSKDILLNYLGDVYTGNSAGKAVDNTESVVDFSKHFENFSVRCMYANVSNIMFDNPYISFNDMSDYNGDPFYLGCCALGMYMLGIVKWLSDMVKKYGCQHIHFTARDGFFLKQAYDRFCRDNDNTFCKSNYLYLSRKAFIPIDVHVEEDMDKLICGCNYRNNTPRSIINRYQAVLKPLSDKLESEYKANGFLLDKSFESEYEWALFVGMLKKIQFSKNIAKKNYDACQKYLKNNIEEGDLIFDLGYSGKLYEQLKNAIGCNVKGVYINFSGYEGLKRNKDNSLCIDSYYDFVPSMSGVVNEYILSDRNPSCIGYENGNPIFEAKMSDYIGDYVINEINRGAYKFVDSFMDSWSTRLNMINMQPIDASLQYEKFLVSPTIFDQAIFDYCYCEDEFYGGVKAKFIKEVWDWQINDRKLKDIKHIKYVNYNVVNEFSTEEMQYQIYLKKIINRNIFIKAIYWLCVDKDFFKKRMREHLRDRSNKKS